MVTTATFLSCKQTLNCGGKIIDISTPIVMGIINVTPDSFYSGSQFMMRRRVYRRAKQILEQGGKIIDIGACSTRPGAEMVSEQVELKRLSKALAIVRKNFPNAIISVDTFRASVAKRMVEDFGANMINDISAGALDENMFNTVAKLGVPYIAMHMQGTPNSMQLNPQYQNVLKEIILFFSEKIKKLTLSGVNDIIVDPGFGFGKTIEHNYTLLNNLDSFKVLGYPVMVGLSRKSMIYKPLMHSPEAALNGTSVLNTIALQKGASILRVHDVLEAVEAVKLTSITQSQQAGINTL